MNKMARDGACLVWLSNGTQLALTRECYESVRDAIQSGISHFEGRGLYGGSVMFSVQHVISVNEETPESRAAWTADAMLP